MVYHTNTNMTNLLDWLVYLVMSLMFTFTYFKTRKVEASIAVHMLWNLCAIVFGI
ncbi:type II CAAX prenyl endopeptidase Rce1 family protein [Lactococcus sp.]|uniref:CPBP family glutamic-type intramembrane protease n=1 Tax=Lactococcus sp. TaxID=44273 RepID=UPI0035AEC2D1